MMNISVYLFLLVIVLEAGLQLHLERHGFGFSQCTYKARNEFVDRANDVDVVIALDTRTFTPVFLKLKLSYLRL